MVPKSNDMYRPVGDYRQLNKWMTKHSVWEVAEGRNDRRKWRAIIANVMKRDGT